VLRRETRGLGLGLAVVNALAASVGAHLDAESAARSSGTRVTVTLPGAVEVDAS
jgi:C4-dicarboxylate-specific signal transduction histidine kinase